MQVILNISLTFLCEPLGKKKKKNQCLLKSYIPMAFITLLFHLKKKTFLGLMATPLSPGCLTYIQGNN